MKSILFAASILSAALPAFAENQAKVSVHIAVEAPKPVQEAVLKFARKRFAAIPRVEVADRPADAGFRLSFDIKEIGESKGETQYSVAVILVRTQQAQMAKTTIELLGVVNEGAELGRTLGRVAEGLDDCEMFTAWAHTQGTLEDVGKVIALFAGRMEERDIPELERWATKIGAGIERGRKSGAAEASEASEDELFRQRPARKPAR